MKFDDEEYDSDKLFGYDSGEDDESGVAGKLQEDDAESDSYEDQEPSVGMKRGNNFSESDIPPLKKQKK